jgi:hypothetical protein
MQPLDMMTVAFQTLIRFPSVEFVPYAKSTLL